MALNPMQLMQMADRLRIFREQHPRVIDFMGAVGRSSLQPGVILELKAAKSEEEMESLAKEALQQIEEKSYVTELERQGVKAVWKYGIAFHGKKVWMERG